MHLPCLQPRFELGPYCVEEASCFGALVSFLLTRTSLLWVDFSDGDKWGEKESIYNTEASSNVVGTGLKPVSLNIAKQHTPQVNYFTGPSLTIFSTLRLTVVLYTLKKPKYIVGLYLQIYLPLYH